MPAGQERDEQALGIGLELNDTDLLGGPIELGPRPAGWEDVDVVRTAPRIGITKAVELDWRFSVRGHRGVSRPLPAA